MLNCFSVVQSVYAKGRKPRDKFVLVRNRMCCYLARDSIVLEKGGRVDPDNTLRICVKSGFAENLVALQYSVLDRSEPILLIIGDVEPFDLINFLVGVEKTTGDESLTRCGSNHVREGHDIRGRNLIFSRGIGSDIELINVA